jgi:hypothetical protein
MSYVKDTKEQQFYNLLPINNFHRFDDIKEWEDVYSHHYKDNYEKIETYYEIGIEQNDGFTTFTKK